MKWDIKRSKAKRIAMIFMRRCCTSLGNDHKRLTFRQAGIDRRLTDVHGRVIH